MLRTILWLSLAILAALRPLTVSSAPEEFEQQFPGWPMQFRGRDIVPLPLSERERAFSKDFPGKIGRFSDGRGEIILRWVTKETRKLHPASDCFRGAGYTVRPLPVRIDGNGDQWSCFAADRREGRLKVCERIRDRGGRSYGDTSAWFWSAMLGNTRGPWWAETVAERE